MKNLYDSIEYFTLRIGDVERSINEPVGWDKVQTSMSRDPDNYGFNYEFIQGSEKLVFAWRDGGGDELEELYKAAGGDGAAELEFGVRESAQRRILFVGSINLNERIKTDKGVSCTVEKTTFESKFRTRYDTKVSLEAEEDLDGNAITAADPNNIRLHSKAIVKETRCKNEEPGYAFLDPNLAGAPYGPSFRHFIQPDTQSQISEELEGVQGMPFAITDTDPFADSRFQYEAEEAGHLEIYFNWYSQGGTYYTAPNVIQSGIDGMFESDIPYGPNNNVWNMYAWLERGGVLIKKLQLPAVTPGNGGPKANTFELDLLVGDRVYVGIEVVHNQLKTGAYTDTWFNDLRFKQLTKAAPSTAKCYRILDLLNKSMEIITGKPGRVLSDFFSPGGAGYNYVITSGYALRKFDPSAQKPVQADMSTLVKSLRAIFNTGVSFQSVNGLDYMRVEPMATFYGRAMVLRLDNAYDWQEVHDKKSVYNEVDIGYMKYASDETNTLDDSHTEQRWLLPITTYKATLQQKSLLIASPYLIEIQRREQYKKKPSTSMANDDALFIIACADELEYPWINWVFDEPTGSITFSKPVNLEIGDIIQVSNGANLGTHTVTAINYSAENSYKISGSFTTEANTGTLSITTEVPGTNPVYAERNQYFEELGNSIDPGGAYNLRILPHRNLYAFAPLLNIGLTQKADTDIIRNTFSKNNGLLFSKLLPEAPGLRLDSYRYIQENEDIALGAFERDAAVFTADQMQFKSEVPYSDIEALKTALRGEYDSAGSEAFKNYGCVAAPDMDGDYWLCAVQDVKYNFAKSESTFIVNKIERY